jgi:3-(methylthio)propionyl---CoA ligase
MPDDVAFVEQLPHTATGKLLKTKLRQEFKEYKLPGCEPWPRERKAYER